MIVYFLISVCVRDTCAVMCVMSIQCSTCTYSRLPERSIICCISWTHAVVTTMGRIISFFKVCQSFKMEIMVKEKADGGKIKFATFNYYQF